MGLIPARIQDHMWKSLGGNMPSINGDHYYNYRSCNSKTEGVSIRYGEVVTKSLADEVAHGGGSLSSSPGVITPGKR